jgi:hypothetical protein
MGWCGGVIFGSRDVGALKLELRVWVQSAAANAAVRNVMKGKTNTIEILSLETIFPAGLPMSSELRTLYVTEYNSVVARELGNH